MTLLEAIQYDLQNGATRESIRNGVPNPPRPWLKLAANTEVTGITAADLEEAFGFVEKSMEEV